VFDSYTRPESKEPGEEVACDGHTNVIKINKCECTEKWGHGEHGH